MDGWKGWRGSRERDGWKTGGRGGFGSPAVGDFTDDLERFLQVDGVGDHLQRQSDVPIARRLMEREGPKQNAKPFR